MLYSASSRLKLKLNFTLYKVSVYHARIRPTVLGLDSRHRRWSHIARDSRAFLSKISLATIVVLSPISY